MNTFAKIICPNCAVAFDVNLHHTNPPFAGHAGDCTFYRALCNGNPTDGICTCGYGWSLVCLGEGDESQLYSPECLEAMRRAPYNGIDPQPTGALYGFADRPTPQDRIIELEAVTAQLRRDLESWKRDAINNAKSAAHYAGDVQLVLSANEDLRRNLDALTDANNRLRAALEAARPCLKARLVDDPHSGAAEALDMIDKVLNHEQITN